jgi:phosphatidylserine/phosphatidylglycerophosphate/cardiolipin synthase-like enzyme
MNLKLNLKYISLIILVIIFLTTISILKQEQKEEINEKISYEKKDIFVEAYMCRVNNCEEVYIQLINQANKSLYCAFFEFNLEDMNNAIKKKEIDKLILVDGDYKYFYEDYILYEKRSSYMHNKFCIIDNKITITGSMNPSKNERDKNQNNIVILYSEEISQIYTNYFRELIKEQQSENRYNHNMSKRYYLEFKNTNISICFSRGGNCLNEIRTEIEKANKNIFFMLFTMTDNNIANIILLKHYKNLEISGLYETSLITKYSTYHEMYYHNLNITRYRSSGKLHHKVFIIDEETIITGSMNPSNNADHRNDENVIIIKNKEIAKIFLEEYNRLIKT